MTNTYSITIAKQRIDFYLEKIQKMCVDFVENDHQLVESTTVLGLIHRSVEQLETAEMECNRKRKMELEQIRSELRSPYPLSNS